MLSRQRVSVSNDEIESTGKVISVLSAENSFSVGLDDVGEFGKDGSIENGEVEVFANFIFYLTDNILGVNMLKNKYMSAPNQTPTKSYSGWQA